MGKNKVVPETRLIAEEADENKITIHHFIVFGVTFASYLQIYALRKSLSYIKSTLVDVWVPANTNGSFIHVYGNNEPMNDYELFKTTTNAENFLGALDSIFMFSYAVALYLMGPLSDRFEPRLVLFFGMCGAAFFTAVFGFATELFHFYSVPFYVCVWIVNGVCQAACWPTVVKLMDNWFGKRKRGLIFGMWSSAASVGSIVGAYVCAEMLKFGYEYAFLVNASILLSISMVTYFGVVSSPRDLYGSAKLNLPDLNVQSILENGEMKTVEIVEPVVESNEKPQAISFFRAVLLPGVIVYALSYTCLKSVNYSIFFWLPYYMRSNFGWDAATSATLSTFFDWGGILGSTLCGLASDLLGKRSPILVAMLALSIFSLGGYASSPNDKLVNGILMGIVGFFVNGATNIVSSAVTADLGRQPAVMNNKEALSTVSGIIEGSGSAGAAIGQAILPFVATAFGWNAIFYMFMIMLFVSVVLLSRLCYRESKEAVLEFRSRVLALTAGFGERSTIRMVVTENVKDDDDAIQF